MADTVGLPSLLFAASLGVSTLFGCSDRPTRVTSDPHWGSVAPEGGDCPAPTGSSHYVSPTGDDEAAGTRSAPWKTLRRATRQAEPGDAVYLLPGTYTERLVVEHSGTEENDIVYAAADASDRPVIDGSGLGVQGGLVEIAGQSHVAVCGLTVRGSAEHGVLVTSSDEGDPSAFVTLVGLAVEDAGEAGIYFEDVEDSSIQGCSTYYSVSSGIGVWYSARISVRDNTVANARYDEELGHEESVSISGTSDFEVSGNEVYLEQGVPCTAGNAAIKAKEGSQRGRMFDNYVHDFYPEGHISLDAWDAGLGGTPTLNAIEIYGNRIVSSGGIRVSSEENGVVEDVKIYNNLLLFTDNGIMLTDAGVGGPRRNVEIFNNTVYEGNDEWFNGITIMSRNVENIVIRNNLIVSEYPIGKILVSDASILAELSVDHNLVSGPGGCYDDAPDCRDLSAVPENIVADPDLVDPESGDCHLAPGSPAIDAGATIESLLTDFDRVARPQGKGIDIGAFEYQL
jgi:hypothetical protein